MLRVRKTPVGVRETKDYTKSRRRAEMLIFCWTCGEVLVSLLDTFDETCPRKENAGPRKENIGRRGGSGGEGRMGRGGRLPREGKRARRKEQAMPHSGTTSQGAWAKFCAA